MNKKWKIKRYQQITKNKQKKRIKNGNQIKLKL